MQAFCFVYPNLLAASQEQAFLWDITPANLSMTITSAECSVVNNQRGTTRQVQLSNTLIFVCFGNQVVVFCRESGLAIYSLDFLRSDYIKWKITLSMDLWASTDRHDAVLIPRSYRNQGPSDSVLTGGGILSHPEGGGLFFEVYDCFRAGV